MHTHVDKCDKYRGHLTRKIIACVAVLGNARYLTSFRTLIVTAHDELSPSNLSIAVRWYFSSVPDGQYVCVQRNTHALCHTQSVEDSQQTYMFDADRFQCIPNCALLSPGKVISEKNSLRVSTEGLDQIPQLQICVEEWCNAWGDQAQREVRLLTDSARVDFVAGFAQASVQGKMHQ